MAEALHDPQAANQNGQQDHIWPISLVVNQAYAASFTCIKCKGIPKTCITDDDGDILCKKCATNIDNTTINKAVQKMVNKFKTKCWTLSQDPNLNVNQTNAEESEGVNLLATKISDAFQCDWIGTIQDYDAHSKQCAFVLAVCDECKTFKCQRKLLDKHISVCPEVKINCPLLCGVTVLRKSKAAHLQNDCMEQLLDCTNDDCKEQLKRKDFQNHVEKVCETRIVECKYNVFGCSVQNMKANELNKHMEEYKFEHLSNKFDFVTTQLSDKIAEQNDIICKQRQSINDKICEQRQSIYDKICKQQQSINDIQLQLEEKENGMQKIAKYIERMALLNVLRTIVHNFDAQMLVNAGWKCVYRKPYSHKTKTDELKALCGENMNIFVGGFHTNNENNIILGAFGPSSVLHRFTNSKSEAFIPSDVRDKIVYKVYWYHVEKKSFGFASVSKVYCSSADTEDTNGDDRLSWHLQGDGGYRLGNNKDLNKNSEYYKIIYIKQNNHFSSFH